MSSVPFIGISSHFLTNDELTESRVCFTQVMFISDIVRSQLIFDIRNFEYSSIVCFGWRGNPNNNNNNTILNYSAPKQMAKTYCLVQIQNARWFTVTVNKRYSTYGE